MLFVKFYYKDVLESILGILRIEELILFEGFGIVFIFGWVILGER